MQFPTRYGRILDFGNPQPDQVDVKDITFSLAHICRFNGHSKKHYSVAQHSVLVAEGFTSPRLRLYALLHDAHEAYTGDITSPLKLYMNSISPGIVDKVEHKIDAAIHAKFGLKYPLDENDKALIKIADKRALSTETRDLTRPSHELALRKTWQFPEPFPEKIVPQSPRQAQRIFMAAIIETQAELLRTEKPAEPESFKQYRERRFDR